MKKLYNLWLFAALLLGVGFTATANLTCDLSWSIPGSVKIYVGGTTESNRVSLSADATSCHVDYEKTFGTVYVKPNDGYFVNSATCTDDSATMAYSSWVGGVSINLAQHDGHALVIDVSQLVNDKYITVDMQSRGNVTAKFTETGREVTLAGGSQNIPYDSLHELTMTFFASNSNPYDSETNPDGYEVGYFYLKHRAEGAAEFTDMNWRLFYASWKNDTITLVGYDEFQVSLNHEAAVEPEPVTMYNVSLNYGAGTTSSVINMIFNTTKMRTISERDTFQVEEGDNVRLVFNTYDYTVTVDGETLEPSDGESTPWLTGAITADRSISISAVEREYGTVYVKLCVDSIEGLIVRNGAIDGPIINLEDYTPTSTTYRRYKYKYYELPVSAKRPKVYVDVEDGYYMTQHIVVDSGDDLEQTVAKYDDPTPLYIKMHKINRNKELAVFLRMGSTANTSMVRFRDNTRTQHSLNPGENIILFDEVCDAPFTVIPQDVDLDNENFQVFISYHGGTTYGEKSISTDSGTFTGILEDLSGESVKNVSIYIFVKTTPPASTVTVTLSDVYEDCYIDYDAVKTYAVAGKETTFGTFVGATGSIHAGNGIIVKLDGVEQSLVDGSCDFTASYATSIEFYKEYTAPYEQSALETQPNIANEPVTVILNFSGTGAQYVKLVDKDMFLLEEVSALANKYSATPTRVFDVEKDNTSQSSRRYAASDVSNGGKSSTLVGVEFPEVELAEPYPNISTLNFTASEGALLIDGVQKSPALAQSYSGIITVVGNVNIDETTGNVTVYGLDGQILLEDAPISSFSDLPHGAYIVNGKKVLK